jgi:hypothetical protein
VRGEGAETVRVGRAVSARRLKNVVQKNRKTHFPPFSPSRARPRRRTRSRMSSIKGATTQEMTSRVPHMTGIGVFMGTVTIGMMNRARHRPVLYRECFCSPPPADDDDTRGACAGATGDLL